MRMKVIAGCAFLLNTILFATYYSVAKEALGRIDPIVFTFFEMVSLAPAGLLIILFSWKDINRTVVKRGIILGSVLCLALFTIAIALKYTTATSTAFFPALNGFVAALIAWAFFREPMKGSTWLAGVLSVGGAALLIFTSSAGNFRGTLIAFLGGLFYTGYVFLCDHEQKDERAQWPLFGVELLTTAVWANLVALLFGDWQAVHPALPKDVWVVLYVAVACTFIPTLITVLLQKYISPVTVSFIYILEPVLGAIIASLYLGEILPVPGYLGGGLVVLGALINTWSTLGRPSRQDRYKQPAVSRGSWVSTLLYPGVGCLLGALLLAHLGNVPPASWSNVYHAWPQFSQDFQQGQGTYVILLLVQAGGWLVAWVSVLLMGCLALVHLLRLLFQPVQSRSSTRSGASPTAIKHLTSAGQAGPGRRVIQPTRRVLTNVYQPDQPGPRRTAGPPLEQREYRPRTTRRLSEQVAPSTYAPGEPRWRITERLPEQPTWYGKAVWPVVPSASSGPITPAPSTEPLLHESLQQFERRIGLPIETFDAERTRSL